jgi:putative transposase
MQDYKRGSHTIWDCKYHIVWVTKYRYPILTGDVGARARELLREIARANEMTIYAGAINRDHVHMLISIPPQLSVSRGVQALKGKSSHKLELLAKLFLSHVRSAPDCLLTPCL